MPNVEINWEIIAPYASVIAAVCALLGIKDFVDLFPTLLNCLASSKENRALHSHPKLRAMRNRIFHAFFPALLLILCYFGADPFITVAYILARLICKWVVMGSKSRSDEYKCAYQISLTYCILASMVIIPEFFVFKLADIEYELGLIIILWTSVVFYALFLLRQFQVFTRNQGFLTAFLYLCALEFLPTALLVASYFVL